ncbi:MAG: metallophosphoesterase [Treponema sp.]|nr:metallophosphoesterase [Treponema sp.]
MKLLLVSDQIDPLVYSTSVKERYSDIDAVFCAGDLPMDYMDFIVDSLGKPTFFVFGNHDLKEYKYYKKDTSVAYQFSKQQYEHSHGVDYISNKVIRCKKLKITDKYGKKSPLLITGVSGSIRYNKGEAQFTETQMRMQLLGLIPGLIWNKLRYGRWCDIFMTHASPRHVHDREDPCHIGFNCFNWFIKTFKPSLMIHGHIHLYDLNDTRATKVHSTMVVNAYSHLVVELNSNTLGESFDTDISILSDR